MQKFSKSNLQLNMRKTIIFQPTICQIINILTNKPNITCHTNGFPNILNQIQSGASRRE
jgi:hypothetical protein